MQIGEGRAFAHGNTLTAKEVVFGDRGAADLVVTKRIEGGGCANRLLDPNAILVVQILLARDGVEAVLHVPDEGLAGAGFYLDRKILIDCE